jgi:hypothetical protein
VRSCCSTLRTFVIPELRRRRRLLFPVRPHVDPVSRAPHLAHFTLVRNHGTGVSGGCSTRLSLPDVGRHRCGRTRSDDARPAVAYWRGPSAGRVGSTANMEIGEPHGGPPHCGAPNRADQGATQKSARTPVQCSVPAIVPPRGYDGRTLCFLCDRRRDARFHARNRPQTARDALPPSPSRGRMRALALPHQTSPDRRLVGAFCF